MPNRYLNLDGSQQIRENYNQISEGFDGVEADIDAAIEVSGSIQAEVTEHKDSSAAHAAEHITYDGPVAGAENMKSAVDSVQQQLNTAVIAGDSGPAAAQAAIDATGHDYGNLKVRLDTEHTAVSEQLAETGQVLISREINVKYPPVPLVAASGDGVVDDTSAIQAVYDLLVDGGTVYFPEGTYSKTDAISINYSNIRTVFAPNAKIIDTVQGKNGFSTGQYLSNIKFEGIDILGCSDDTFASAADAVFIGEGTNNVEISDSRFDGYTIGILTEIYNYDITVSRCEFYNMTYIPSATAGGYGIVYQASRNTKTFDCYFDKSIYRHAIYVGRNPFTDVSGKDHTIQRNTFEGDSQPTYITGFELRLKIMANSDVTVSNNTFTGGVGHILIQSTQTVNADPKNIIISNNTFKDIVKGNSTHSWGIGEEGPGSFMETVTISGNIFNNCDCIGHIGINLGKKITIEGNTVDNAVSGHGITSQNKVEDLRIISNDIRGLTSSYRCVYLNTSSTVSDPSTHSLNVVIRGNDFGNAQIGIYFNSTLTATIENNLIELTTQQSVYFANVKFTGVIRNNTFRNGNSAIHFNSLCVDPIWIYDNVFEGQTVNQIENDGNAYLCEPIKNGRTSGSKANKRTFVLSAAPTSGTWLAGDEALFSAAVAGGYVGTTCITTGTPGVWKNYGAVQSS
ncbi:glycosyl hydrolase family 28-related protein [Paenibacillus sp. S150]|uniref:glycosyl hydrolase family 28-related protein n=1 Tax=Paenibacillus sp. S150 TaxID=2749826 RepID=UPI001C567B6D|nr:glycosyl hydrolase family 28-related protein [Paenibacillus sp. S150]MBW4083538.1 right-handed parallel beta-helix repeat-containing protein [Paenibacillus sp. S150]